MTSTAMAAAGRRPAGSSKTLPQLNVLGQYIKDFSFENPNAPRSLAPSQTQPAINIQINVDADQMSATDFEVTLCSKARPTRAARCCSLST